MFHRRPPKGLPDEELQQHPIWRRYTESYRRKRRIVRDLWITIGIVMLNVPTGAIPVLALGATFASFMILDETA